MALECGLDPRAEWPEIIEFRKEQARKDLLNYCNDMYPDNQLKSDASRAQIDAYLSERGRERAAKEAELPEGTDWDVITLHRIAEEYDRKKDWKRERGTGKLIEGT